MSLIQPGSTNILPQEDREGSKAMCDFVDALCRAYPNMASQIRFGANITVKLDNGMTLHSRVRGGSIITPVAAPVSRPIFPTRPIIQ